MNTSGQPGGLSGGFIMPGKALKGVMLGLVAINVTFAVAINFGGASRELFNWLCGSSAGIWSGQIWRLFTAPLMHEPQGAIGHLFFTVLGLFFLAPSLEANWGSKRLLRFLFLSGIIAYSIQLLLELIIPSSYSARLIPAYWYGAGPVIEAVAVAWALSFRGQTVRLFMVLPVSSKALLSFVIIISVLRLLWLSQAPEGLLAPFGGLFAGWFLGGGTPSPARKAWLKLRLKQLDAQANREASERKQRVAQSRLRVIRGGSEKNKGEGPGGGSQGRGPDGRWLN